MKGKLFRILALLTSLLMLFSLVACTGDENDETTTANTTDTVATETLTNDEGETVTVENKTDENSTTEENKTSEKEDKTSEKTNADKTTNKITVNNNKTTNPASTTKKTETAPVNGTIAEIVSFYNNAANRTKARDFSATKKELTKVTIDGLDSDSKFFNSLKEEIIFIGNGIINRLAVGGKPVIVDEVFDGGKPTKEKVSKEEWLPIMESPKMSTLTPDGVKSATCKKDGDGYIVTIVLKSEKGTLQKKPPIHATCVNYLRLEVLDLGPLNDNIKTAEMNYIDSTNSGTKFVAKVNKNNLLDYMNTYMTIKGGGTGTLLGVTATASLHGTYTAEIKFKW